MGRPSIVEDSSVSRDDKDDYRVSWPVEGSVTGLGESPRKLRKPGRSGTYFNVGLR